MSYSTGELIAMAAALEQSDDYRILRRLVPRGISKPPVEGAKIGILVDFETTGLDTSRDEVIEIGMVKFSYSDRGDVTAVVDTFNSFNQPSKQIPAKVTVLTGITDEMVKGQRIDAEAVSSFATDADIVIAHNAQFDRRFAERGWPVFAEKCWACSVREIDWRKHGIDGAKLGYLLAAVGYFHDGHRAVEDCQALLEILARELPKSNQTALAALLERSNRPTYRIWAERAPADCDRKTGLYPNAGSGSASGPGSTAAAALCRRRRSFNAWRMSQALWRCSYSSRRSRIRVTCATIGTGISRIS